MSASVSRQMKKKKKIGFHHSVSNDHRSLLGFPDGASDKEPACHFRRCKRHRFNPWVRKIPWRRARQPISAFLPGESHGQSSLAGYSPRGHKERYRTEVTEHACTHAWWHYKLFCVFLKFMLKMQPQYLRMWLFGKRGFKEVNKVKWGYISSVQFSTSVVSDSLQPHESQHARPPCPSPTPGVHSDSCPSSQWCHPAISSSVIPFSSCPQSLPA